MPEDENGESYRDPSTGRLTGPPPWGIRSSEDGREFAARRRTSEERAQEEARQILSDVGVSWADAPQHLRRIAIELAGGKITAFGALWRALGHAESRPEGIAFVPPAVGEACALCGAWNNALPLPNLRKLYDSLAGHLPPRPGAPASEWVDADRFGDPDSPSGAVPV